MSTSTSPCPSWRQLAKDLRWSYSRDQGLPWHGYWVLRRNAAIQRPDQPLPEAPGLWQAAPELSQPLGLPIYHAAYPPTAMLPGAAADPWGVLAKPRVKAGNQAALQAHFGELAHELAKLLAGGPVGSMAGVALELGEGTAAAGDAQPAPSLGSALMVEPGGAGAAADGPSRLDAVCVGGELLYLQKPGVELAKACFTIVDLDRSAGAVRVAGNLAQFTGSFPWSIGEIVRDYEVFVAPAALAAEPAIDVGLDWHTFGVSAADERPYSGDGPGEWGAAGSLVGNEGRVAAAVPVARVRRSLPSAPKPWIQPGPVYASRMDAQGLSYHTFRWLAASTPKGTRVQVLRALDETLFAVDWALRPRKAKTAEEPRFVELMALLGVDAKKAALIGNRVDKLEPVAKDQAAKGIPASVQAAYRGLSDVALQALASLPGMEAAFVPVTVGPLEPGECADMAGVDDLGEGEYKPSANLRAWQDAVSGASENRYVYAGRTVDAAKNGSVLSLPAVPVTVPRGRPLAAPVILRALSVPPEVPGGAWGAKIQWLAGDGAEEWVVRRQAVGADGAVFGPVVEVNVGAAIADADAVLEWQDTGLPVAASFTYDVVALALGGESCSAPATLWLGFT